MTVVEQQVSEEKNLEQRARPLQKRAKRTRDAVVAGAARIIACEGSGVTVNDFVEASGVTKGGMYFHFSSKDAVVNAVIEEAVQRCDFLHSPRRRRGDSGAAVRDLLREYFAHVSRDWPVRATAVLWTDPHYAEAARAATYDPLGAAVTAILNGTGSPASIDTADAVMAIVCGVTTTAGPAGLGDGGDLDTILRLTRPVLAAVGADTE
jgi:AcrR family transcriptional regulator|tara:strand:- start:118 stop:741 length:624 start_codon:yes stop_codon:yes gene_type:complete